MTLSPFQTLYSDVDLVTVIALGVIRHVAEKNNTLGMLGF